MLFYFPIIWKFSPHSTLYLIFNVSLSLLSNGYRLVSVSILLHYFANLFPFQTKYHPKLKVTTIPPSLIFLYNFPSDSCITYSICTLKVERIFVMSLSATYVKIVSEYKNKIWWTVQPYIILLPTFCKKSVSNTF